MKLLSILIVFIVVCFTSLSTLQFSGKMETAVTYQCNIINKTISFFKTAILYPYMSAFIEVNEFVKVNPILNNEKANKKIPLKRKKLSNIFQHLYYILSTIMVSNRMGLFFLLIIFAGMNLFGKQQIRNFECDSSIRLCSIRFYVKWILEFLNPREKFLKNLDNEYDIDNVKVLLWEITRTLNLIFGVRVFFMHKKAV